MTSRPAPGIQEALQNRGAGPAYAHGRRLQDAQKVQQKQPVGDGQLESGRLAGDESRTSRARPKGKSIQLEALQTTIVEGPRQPPKGRPQYFYATATPSRGDDGDTGQEAFNLPLPPRPGTSAPGDASQQARVAPGGTGVKGEPSEKPPSSEAPAQAAILPNNRYADFYPWAGNQAEEVLSENLVKSGISNKSQIMNETNTARPSLWSNLKHKTGTSTLSSLFVAVLEKRQACSRLTAPNTFKPPPRLTLRDSTRETWLHDLANPAISLRRLSRTIPHGVTGKVLLDQCLNKNIPIPRAMWLVKCVGINEMRAHKRKGQAGTITWLRGWTSAVEQFLETTMNGIGQSNWKTRITYALHLITHLFKEQLLEADHFLEWLLKCLSACPSERLFAWLLVVSIATFWSSLESSRRRGKRLAESLLDHAEKLYAVDEDVRNTPLLEMLETIIMKLVARRPACLLLPAGWAKYRAVLETFIERHPQTQVIGAISLLTLRVERVSGRGAAAALPQHVDNLIYETLDNVDFDAKIDIDDLALECMETTSDAIRLTDLTLRWAASFYRAGRHRSYLAIRLLRKWTTNGADVYTAILTQLPLLAKDKSIDSDLVFRIIAELVRSRTFPLGKYMQWLITTGSLRSQDESSACAERLLTALPLAGLPVQILNLRQTLLRQTSYSGVAETQSILEAELFIDRQLERVSAGMTPVENGFHAGTLGPTARLEIAHYLRRKAVALLEGNENTHSKDLSPGDSSPASSMTLAEFTIMRSYLEYFQDLAILADVVGIIITSHEPSMLGAAADTLHYHHRSFRAIGAFEPLMEKLTAMYTSMRTLQLLERNHLLAIANVARTAFNANQLVQLIHYDIGRLDQRNGIAACSPVSDTMIEGTTPMDFEEEMERILSSGNSMDQQIMHRLFTRIVNMFEEHAQKKAHLVDSFSTMLSRLRAFDEKTFDAILSDWLGNLLRSDREDILSLVIPALAASKSLDLSQFLEVMYNQLKEYTKGCLANVLKTAIIVISMFLPDDTKTGLFPTPESYKFALELRRLRETNGAALVRLFLLVLHYGIGEQERHMVAHLLARPQVLDVFQNTALSSPDALKALGDGCRDASESCRSFVSSLLSSLLDPDSRLDLSRKAAHEQIDAIVAYAGHLSVPFCQLALCHILSSTSESTDEDAPSYPAALTSAIRRAVEIGQPCWSELIIGIDSHVVQEIRRQAEREIILKSAFLCGSSSAPGSDENIAAQVVTTRFLGVLRILMPEQAKEGQYSPLVALIERFRGLCEAFGKIGSVDAEDTKASMSLTVSDLFFWSDALLQLLILSGPALLVKASNQHQAALLWTLRVLMCRPALQKDSVRAQFVADVATILSDGVNEDVRRHLARLELARGDSDSRAAFIFGAVSAEDGWLNLMKPAPTLMTTPTVSSPQTPQPSSSRSPAPQTPLPGISQGSQRMTQHQHQQHQAFVQTQLRVLQQQQENLQKTFPQQLQRIASNNPAQFQQFQQALVAARNAQSSSPLQRFRQAGLQQSSSQQQQQQQHLLRRGSQGTGSAGSSTSTGAGAAGNVGLSNKQQDKVEMKSVPFAMSRWDILPESGAGSTGNETAISLSLFGARKV